MSFFSKILTVSALASACVWAGPVSHFGKLVTCGGKICGEKTGSTVPVQVKGPSLFWSTGLGGGFYSASTVDWFVSTMDIGVIRAAMAIKYWDAAKGRPISMTDGNNASYTADFGYLSADAAGQAGNNKKKQKALIKTIVDAAIANDIYVIVDWHSHVAHEETSEAVAFFTEMANTYKNVPNIIWEIFNEPNVAASTVNNYARSVVSAIRNTGNNNLIVVGSNKYSAFPYEQSKQDLKGSNIAYTLHFYAASHPLNGSYGQDARNAVSNNVPIFATEWGTTGYSGDGTVDKNASDTWTTWMDDNKISNCNWFAGADEQASAMFKAGTSVASLSTSNLSESGQYFQTYMTKNPWHSFVPASSSLAKNLVVTMDEGSTKTFSTELGIRGTISGVSEPGIGKVSFTGNSITYESAAMGSPDKLTLDYIVGQGGSAVKGRIFVNIANRKPVVKDTAFSVSYKSVKKFTLRTLGAIDPNTGSSMGMTLKAASVTAGSVTFSRDTLFYTPSGTPGTAKLTYEIANAGGSSSATVNLTCENQAPEVYWSTKIANASNLEPVALSLLRLRAKDADGDEIKFKVVEKGDFPGIASINATGDTLTYVPEPNKIGTVTLLVVVTDGTLDSEVGEVLITLVGNGTSFDGTIAPPREIDGYVSPNPKPSSIVKTMVLANVAKLAISDSRISVALPAHSNIQLAIYGVKGNKVMTVAEGRHSAGNHEFAIDRSGLPAGMYIVQLKYGNRIKSIKFINR